jgi:DNA-binding transcriptional regulator LsrR (DeoR family)
MVAKELQELMVLVAWMYHDEGLTQGEIAKKLNLSRATVTRLLQKARQERIVEIRMTRPIPLQYDLARRLREIYDIKEVIVAKSYESREETLNAVGQAGAEHLAAVLAPGCRLGVVGWSRTLGRIVPYLKPVTSAKGAMVNEVVGSLGPSSDRYNVSMQIAEHLQLPIETLAAPMIVQDKAARDAMLAEPVIAAAFEHARHCDVVFVGLGHVGLDWTMVYVGQLTLDQAAQIQLSEAVGDILGRCYDIQGRQVPRALDDRLISLTWDDLLQIPYVVAMASGPEKVDPILGALRGRICHCLVTDTATAQKVLQQTAG